MYNSVTYTSNKNFFDEINIEFKIINSKSYIAK